MTLVSATFSAQIIYHIVLQFTSDINCQQCNQRRSKPSTEECTL